MTEGDEEQAGEGGEEEESDGPPLPPHSAQRPQQRPGCPHCRTGPTEGPAPGFRAVQDRGEAWGHGGW